MMRPLLYVLSFLAVMGMAFWAYRENYATQAAQREVDALQQEIGALREALSIQRAEWAYLNRPDRLRELVTLNFDRLGLFPMEPSQFGHAAQIPMPPPPVAADLVLENPVDTAAYADPALEGAADPDLEATP